MTRKSAAREAGMKIVSSNPNMPPIQVAQELAKMGFPTTPQYATKLRRVLRYSDRNIPRLRGFKRTGEKMEAIAEALKENPRASPKEITGLLEGKGVSTSEGYVRNIRNDLRSSGLLQKYAATRLNSLEAAIRRQLFHSPETNSNEILQRLQKHGVRTTRQRIDFYRTRMRKEGYNLPPLYRKPKPLPQLTPQQKEVHKQMQAALPGLIRQFGLNRRIGDLETEDVKLEAELQSMRAAASYKHGRSTLPTTHLANHLKHLPARIYRDSLRRTLGITSNKAEALMALLKAEGEGRAIAQTAIKHNLSPQEARELLNAHKIAFPNQAFEEW